MHTLDTLELEWTLMKKVQLEETAVPNKYKELIGLGIAAATKCRYCALFHTEVARLNGATQEEIDDALRFAKTVSGWSTYINGSQADYEQFQRDVCAAVEYVRKQMAAAPPQGVGKAPLKPGAHA